MTVVEEKMTDKIACSLDRWVGVFVTLVGRAHVGPIIHTNPPIISLSCGHVDTPSTVGLIQKQLLITSPGMQISIGHVLDPPTA